MGAAVVLHSRQPPGCQCFCQKVHIPQPVSSHSSQNQSLSIPSGLIRYGNWRIHTAREVNLPSPAYEWLGDAAFWTRKGHTGKDTFPWPEMEQRCHLHISRNSLHLQQIFHMVDMKLVHVEDAFGQASWLQMCSQLHPNSWESLCPPQQGT